MGKITIHAVRRRYPNASFTVEFLLVCIIFYVLLSLFGWIGDQAVRLFLAVLSIFFVVLGIYTWRVVRPNFTDRDDMRYRSFTFRWTGGYREPEFLTYGSRRPFMGKPEKDWQFRKGFIAIFEMTSGAICLYFSITRYFAS
ncbi:MAG: hypothetical protein AB1384_04945 [Actinomycetota bacterium]